MPRRRHCRPCILVWLLRAVCVGVRRRPVEALPRPATHAALRRPARGCAAAAELARGDASCNIEHSNPLHFTTHERKLSRTQPRGIWKLLHKRPRPIDDQKNRRARTLYSLFRDAHATPVGGSPLSSRSAFGTLGARSTFSAPPTTPRPRSMPLPTSGAVPPADGRVAIPIPIPTPPGGLFAARARPESRDRDRSSGSARPEPGRTPSILVLEVV